MQQYQLRTCSIAPNDPKALKYHVAKLNCKEFQVGQFHNLRLYRGSLQTASGQRLKRATAAVEAGGEDDEDEEMTDAEQRGAVDNDEAKVKKTDGSASAAGDSKKKSASNYFKRKTRVYYDSYEGYGRARQLRRQEALPWLLEDMDDGSGEVNFVGRLEAGQDDRDYVLFVYENGGFSVMPVSRWYKFNQRITYRTLTADEAEEQMNNKNRTMNKWMMHKLVKTEQQREHPSAADGTTAGNKNLIVTSNRGARGKKQMSAGADELLYDEHFDDDEEYGDALEEEDAQEEPLDEELEMRKKGQLRGEDEEDFDEGRLAADRSRLREQAKDTTKLLRKMKQDVLQPGANFDELGLITDSDDEDPYASSASGTESEGSASESGGEESEEEIEKQLKNLGRAAERSAAAAALIAKSSKTSGSDFGSRSASPALTAGSRGDGGKRKRVVGKEDSQTARSSRAGSPASVTSDRSLSVTGGLKPSKKIKSQQQQQQQQQQQLLQRSSSPAQEQTQRGPSSSSARASDEGGNSSDLITREDVVRIFQQSPNQSTTTAHLIQQLKRKLKKDKRNQTVLIDIVKRVAQKSADGNMWTLK